MENRIKEQQLALFADRTSAQTLRANQLRLYFASFAYTLLELLRRWGLQGTQLARAQCDTIRLKLLKIGVRIRVSVRAVRLSFDEGFPEAGLFGRCWPASRAYRCAVSNCTPGHRGEPRWSSPGALCPSSGWRGRTSGNTLAAGGPDQAFARIRCPTLRRDAIQPLQTDQTPQNLRLLSRSG